MTQIVNKAVELDGRRCLILRDEVAAGPSQNAAILVDDTALSGGAKLWMSAEVMDEMQVKHGKLHVYGLWQILMASGYITDDHKVHVLATEDDGNGHYLYHHEDVWHSGIVFQEELRGLPDDVMDELNDEDVNYLSVDVDDLERPVKRVLSMAEQIALRKKEKKITERQVVAAISVVFALLFGVERYLDFVHKKEKLDYEIEETVLSTIRAKTDILKTERISYRPDQRAQVFPIWYLAKTLPDDAISTPHLMLSDPGAEIVVKEGYRDLTRLLPADVYYARSRVSGETVVNWKVTDGH